MKNKSAEDIIRALNLQPHPEGGHFREIYRDAPSDGGRGVVTAIYFLLKKGEASAWHRVDAVEMWHYYAGATLKLSISEDTAAAVTHRLGPEIDEGELLFHVVPKGAWQSAESLGEWTLVGCTVSPAFEFSGFEMAPAGWQPNGASVG